MITMLSERPRPPLTPCPPKGSIYVDPVFGHRILRVTDATDGVTNETAYGYWPTFNKNSTRMVVMSSDAAGNRTPWHWTFTPALMRATKVGKMFPTDAPTGKLGWEDAIWSHTVVTDMVGHNAGGMDIYRYSVTKKTYTKLIDVAAVSGLTGVMLYQASMDINDRYYAATLKNPQNGNLAGFIVVDLITPRVVLHVEEDAFDEVQIDKSGVYLMYKTGREGRIYNLAAGTAEPLTDGYPDVMMGHSDSGTGMCVGFEDWAGTLRKRSFALPHVHALVYDATTIQGGWPDDQHISLLANDETWFSAGYYQPTYTPSDRPCSNEILLIKNETPANGLGVVRRLCHHRGGGPDQYWDAPRPDRSRDGRWIAYNSTWEGKLGPNLEPTPGRRDLFIVDTL